LGSSGSFQPQAVALVMSMKQLGLGLNIILVWDTCSKFQHIALTEM
jgi:hypothetical protein